MWSNYLRAFRTKDSSENLTTVGIAQGQFPFQEITAGFRRKGIKATVVGAYRIYPMAKTGMVLSFIDASTMIFGTQDAVRKSLDVRDGQVASMLTNPTMMEAMKSVDMEPLWSVLDEKGTQFMVHQLLENAGSVTDFDTVRRHLQSCRYGMDFQHGVHLNLSIATGDNFIAATLASIFNAVITVRKMTGPEVEKQAFVATSVHSDLDSLNIQFASSDDGFTCLLKSALFQDLGQALMASMGDVDGGTAPETWVTSISLTHSYSKAINKNPDAPCQVSDAACPLMNRDFLLLQNSYSIGASSWC